MDILSLQTLGKIAGLGGIAIGMIALLVRPIVDQISALPNAQRGPTVRLIAIGAFAIGALGIVAWLASSLGGHNTIVNGAPCSSSSGRDASGNKVSCGVVPSNSESKP
jgi:hypothetical protein